MTQRPPNGSYAAVFLDRDGTIMEDVNYCGDPKLVAIFPGVSDALRRLRDAGYKLFVITNQSGIDRGYFSERDYRAVEMEVGRQLGAGLIDATYYCPDKPGRSSKRRKPAPEMVFEAAREHRIELSASYFVGDKSIDVECGANAGVRTILIQKGRERRSLKCEPDRVARDFVEAASIILEGR